MFQNIAAHYTAPMILGFLESTRFDLKYSYSLNDDLGINQINFDDHQFLAYREDICVLKGWWLSNKYLVWQSGVLSRCLFGEKIDLIILLGEMTIISNWLAAIACRFRGIPVAFRGHGLYGNENRVKLLVRTTFYRLADMQLVYERRAKNLLIENGFVAESIHVIFNSLNYVEHIKYRGTFDNVPKSEIYRFFQNPDLPVLVFIGRLTPVKKLDMLLDVVARINSKNEISVNLLVIGDGGEKEKLLEIASKKLKMRNIHFEEGLYDEQVIAGYLSKADLCVSPGNVGLTCIHSLSMGTPVCTHSNLENQMPEVEAITDGKNGVLFNEGDCEDLYFKIVSWLRNYPNKKDSVREKCYEVIDVFYNPSFQEQTLLQAASRKKPLV